MNVLRVLKMTDQPLAPSRADTRSLDNTIGVSPVDGYIMYNLAGPPVRAGDSLVTIGLHAKGPL